MMQCTACGLSQSEQFYCRGCGTHIGLVMHGTDAASNPDLWQHHIRRDLDLCGERLGVEDYTALLKWLAVETERRVIEQDPKHKSMIAWLTSRDSAGADERDDDDTIDEHDVVAG